MPMLILFLRKFLRQDAACRVVIRFTKLEKFTDSLTSYVNGFELLKSFDTAAIFSPTTSRRLIKWEMHTHIVAFCSIIWGRYFFSIHFSKKNSSQIDETHKTSRFCGPQTMMMTTGLVNKEPTKSTASPLHNIALLLPATPLRLLHSPHHWLE